MKLVSQTNLLTATILAGAILTFSATANAQSATSRATTSSGRARAAQAPVVESVRSGKLIAPDGEIAITSIDRKWDRITGTGTINEAAVTPSGKLSTRAANLTRDPDGTIVTKGTFTDFDGHSANYTETTKRTATGPVVIGRQVDDEGNVATYETTSERTGRNETKLTTVTTHAGGAKTKRIEILAPAKPVSSS